jgi:predicted RNA-binding Zn-ribbon protein involved in translation (DUF1610 family)
MTDSIEDVYQKYLGELPSEDSGAVFVHDPGSDESDLTCPKCESTNLNRKAGYRGEYTCKNCGHFWRR